jgi:hypothetical protein
MHVQIRKAALKPQYETSKITRPDRRHIPYNSGIFLDLMHPAIRLLPVHPSYHYYLCPRTFLPLAFSFHASGESVAAPSDMQSPLVPHAFMRAQRIFNTT